MILNLFQYQKQSLPVLNLKLIFNKEYIGCHETKWQQKFIKTSKI